MTSAASTLTSPAAFTISDLVRLRKVSRQAIVKQLEAHPATDWKKVRGQQALTWASEDLPTKLRAELAGMLVPGQTFADLLHASPPAWQPSRPWVEIPTSFQQEALNRRDVLAPLMPLQHEWTLVELHAMALPGWLKAFGGPAAKVFTVDWLRYLMDRTTQYDGGRGEWQRPELYLDAAAMVAHKQTAASVAHQSMHETLFTDSAFVETKDKAHPTAADLAAVLAAACRHLKGLHAQTQDSPARRAITRSLTDWLLVQFPCPTLGKSPAAFHETFVRDYRKWKVGGCRDAYFHDDRADSGRKAYRCEPCSKILNHTARDLRGHRTKGNQRLAFKQLWNLERFCEACADKIRPFIEDDPDYFPNWMLYAKPSRLEVAKDQGWKHARDIGPTTTGNWSDTPPGSRFVLDDETPNHIVYDYVDGELIIGVAQNIECIDLGTSYPIDFYMYIGAPNWLAIRRLMWQVGTSFGLPDSEWLMEGGAFKGRNVVGKYDDRDKARAEELDKDALPMREVEEAMRQHFEIEIRGVTENERQEERELGIREAGVPTRHARSHRGKSVIENYFHATQKMESFLPGFRGFNAREEMPDRLKEFIARCKSGKEDHPGNELLSLEELRKNYKAVREEYMHTPQTRSKRLRGRSPLKAMKERLDRKPMRQLSPEMEYILATNKRIVPLNERGIVIPLNKFDKANYYNPNLGRWHADRIDKVLAFINIFNRKWITVSDLKRRNYLMVPRQELMARTASKDQLAYAEKNKRGFIAEATGRFGRPTHPLISTVVRGSEYSEDAKALGRFRNEQVEQQAHEENTEQREVNDLRRRADALDYTINVDLNNPRQRQALDLELSGHEGKTGETP